MTTMAHRDLRGPFVDLFDWPESPLAVLHPSGGGTLRVEDGGPEPDRRPPGGRSGARGTGRKSLSARPFGPRVRSAIELSWWPEGE